MLIKQKMNKLKEEILKFNMKCHKKKDLKQKKNNKSKKI